MKKISTIFLIFFLMQISLEADNWIFSENYSNKDISNENFESFDFFECSFFETKLKNANFANCEFSSCILQNIDFSGVDLTSSCFRNCDIKNVSFNESKTYKTEFCFCNLDNVDFSNSSLYFVYSDSSSEEKHSIKESSLKKCDLVESLFEGITIENVDFSEANLSGATFRYVNFVNVNFSNANLKEVSFSVSVGLKDSQIREASDLNDVSLTYLNLKKWDLSNLDLKFCKFWHSDLSESNFNNSVLEKASFGDANLTKSSFAKANIVSASFTSAIASEANFDDSNLTSAECSSANFSRASFKGANLLNVHITASDCSYANFANANLSGADFSGSDLKNANFEGANLTGTDFLGAKNFTIPKNAIFYITRLPDGTFRTDSIQISSSPEETLVLFEKTKFNLSVAATEKDSKKLTYTWYVDKNNGKGFVKAGSKPTFAITPKANMVGWQYYCAVSNGSETRNTSVSSITAVRTPVKITSKPKALNAFKGAKNSGFSVSATGSDVKYQWQVYKIISYNAKGKAIYDWVDILGATSSMYIPDSSFENNGLKYRCKVYNSGSSAYTSGVKFTVKEAAEINDITIYQKPESAKQAHSVASEENATEYFDITLTANASGYKIKYQWYLNGEKIEKATKKTLSIKKPQLGEYQYSCKVYNEASKGVIATEDEASFLLVISSLKVPMEITGQVLKFEDESGDIFYFAATSKSSCVLIDYGSYDYWEDYGDDYWVSTWKKNYYSSSSYSFKRNNDENASLKLTFTKNVYFSKDSWEEGGYTENELTKLSSVKIVLNGILSAFDENGEALFKTQDGRTYNVKRVTSEMLPFPESVTGKVFDDEFYAVDKKNCWHLDCGEGGYYFDESVGKGTYTYKKISDNIAKYTVAFRNMNHKSEGYVIRVEENYYTLVVSTTNKKWRWYSNYYFNDDYPFISDLSD